MWLNELFPLVNSFLRRENIFCRRPHENVLEPMEKPYGGAAAKPAASDATLLGLDILVCHFPAMATRQVPEISLPDGVFNSIT